MFLENILDEVIELFPSKHIHIGGDEAPTYRWENCAKFHVIDVSQQLGESIRRILEGGSLSDLF